jgi:hypothetical protein
LEDPENRIVRPRQVYLGSSKRDYVDIAKRSVGADKKATTIVSSISAESKRRFASDVWP